MNAKQRTAMVNVLAEVSAERERQHGMHGEQVLEDGHESWHRPTFETLLRTAGVVQRSDPDWSCVLVEEVCEVILAGDRDNLRAELIQVAAVAVQWVEAIDRANPRQTHEAAPGSTKVATVGAGEGADAPAFSGGIVGLAGWLLAVSDAGPTPDAGRHLDPANHSHPVNAPEPAAVDAPGWDGTGSPVEGGG